MLSGTRLQKVALAVVLASSTLWPTSAYAGEGDNTPVDPLTLRHYYQTNNLVGLFDALVLRDGQEVRVLKPEVLLIDQVTFDDLRYLAALIEVLEFTGIEATEIDPSDDRPAATAYFDGIRPHRIDSWPKEHLSKLSAMFGSSAGHLELFQWQIEEGLRSFQSNIDAHPEGMWSTCSHLELDLNDEGDLVPRDEVTHGAIAAVHLAKVSNFETFSRCYLEALLFGTGLRGVLRPGRSNIFELRDSEVFSGPVVLCALEILQDKSIRHLMDRNAALSAVSALQEDGVTCD